MSQSRASTATSQTDSAYQDLERKLQSVQAQRNHDLQSTTSQLLDIDTKLKQLDPRLDNLEAKAIQSMQYHVDTNNALTAVQSQMSQMMMMMQAIASKKHRKPRPSTTIDSSTIAPHLSTVTETIHSQQILRTCSVLPENAVAALPTYTLDHDSSRSVTSISSGSQHAQPPPKKHLKRSMPDAMEDMNMASSTNDDDSSSSSFGSTPPLYPLQGSHPPSPLPMLMPPSCPPSATSEMETADTSLPFAMPDLEDHYKLTDEYASGVSKSPDKGSPG
jgi:hypothetical protein